MGGRATTDTDRDETNVIGQTTPARDWNGTALGQSCARRDTYWVSVGMVEQDVLGHLISPDLMGRPAWPTTRQAYRIIRRPGSIIIATDGMSDPFDDSTRQENDFGMELFIETADILPEHAGSRVTFPNCLAVGLLNL